MWTKKGLGVLMIGATAGILGMAFGSGSLVAAFIVVLPFLALAQIATRQPRIEVQRHVSARRVHENDTITITLTIRNQGTSTVFLHVAEVLPGLIKVKQGSNDHRCTLRSGEETAHAFVVEAPVKGRYSLAEVAIRVEDPFGLSYHGYSAALHDPLTVLPASEQLRKAPGKTRFPRIFLGQQSVRAPGQGMEFFGLREYLPGDPLKEVNWKASARSKSLVVNQRERETLADVTIMVDAREVSAYGRADDNGHLWSARAAASLTAYFLNQRDRVRLVTYGENTVVLEPDGGERHYYRIMEALTDLQARGNLSFLEAVHKVFARLNRRSPVVVISSCVDDPSLVEGCGLLRAHEMEVLVVSVVPKWHTNDPDAQALLDLERRVALMDLRGAETRVIEWDGEQPLSVRIMDVSLT